MRVGKHLSRPAVNHTAKGAVWWHFYFFSLLFLQFFGLVTPSPAWQVLLALFVVLPLPEVLSRWRYTSTIRQGLAVVAALVLAWHQSNLPAPALMISLVIDPNMRFSSEFILSFWWQLITVERLAVLAGLVVLAILTTRRIVRRFSPFIIGGVVLVSVAAGFFPSGAGNTVVMTLESDAPIDANEDAAVARPVAVPKRTLDEQLADFYATEAGRFVPYSVEHVPNTDIILLQICSFGWEDFTDAGVDMKPFFSQFDTIFTRFNSADSYSHTAGIRLLRGFCGQTNHGSLFNDAAPGCYPMQVWRDQGYRTFSAYNHNGQYSDFAATVQRLGKVDPAISLTSLRAPHIGFDDSPIYRDYDVLSHWWRTYATASSSPAALYYNTISLHAGVHEPAADWWKRGNNSEFKEHVNELTGDLNHFFADLKASGRKAIVVVVAEHGAALKKTTLQPQTVREVPLPGITIVPAAIKLFGPEYNNRPEGFGVLINEPSSYAALYMLVNRMLVMDAALTDREMLRRLTTDLPSTAMVASSWNGTIIEQNDGFYYKKTGGAWDHLPDSVRIPTALDSLPASFLQQ